MALPRPHSSRILLSTATAAAVALALLSLAACGDGSDEPGTSGSGSATSKAESPAGTKNAEVLAAVDAYSMYVTQQVDELLTLTTTFTDAVRAGDLKAAHAAYAPSREPWERIEPIAELVSTIDGVVDSRVDDFEGPTDPEFTGWHRLEYLLFAKGTTEGGAPFADKLDDDLQTLKDGVAELEIPPTALPVGASELIEEVSLGKITGEEDRYAKTDLWDFAANVDGSRKAVELLSPALAETDNDLLTDINASFAALDKTLEPLRTDSGWVLYCQEDDEFPSERCPEVTVDKDVRATLTAQLADLSEQTSQMAGALGLE